MRVSEFKAYLEAQFPGVKFYNGSINRNESQCIGVYTKGTATPHIAIGGKNNTSFGMLPVSILVHWTEDADQCEQQAQEIYEDLFGLSSVTMGNSKVFAVTLLDPCPVDIRRDDNNICEMVIRVQIIYER